MNTHKMEKMVDRVLEDINYRNNVYFTELLDKNFDKEDFIETQIQFFFAVVFFNRPMSALAAKIPDAKLRLEILRNVWEEHGEGNIDMMHQNSFLTLLQRIGGITSLDVRERSLWPEVRIFNTCLSGVCILDDYITGVATIGIIEKMFSEISTILGNAIVKLGWLNSNTIIHYDLHKELDVKHSQDFFDVIEKNWEKNEDDRYYIEQGIRMGATLFNNLYTSLYKNRKNRLNRKFYGSHSRAEGYTIL